MLAQYRRNSLLIPYRDPRLFGAQSIEVIRNGLKILRRSADSPRRQIAAHSRRAVGGTGVTCRAQAAGQALNTMRQKLGRF